MDPSFLDDLPADTNVRRSSTGTLDSTKVFDSRIIYSPPPKESNHRNSSHNHEDHPNRNNNNQDDETSRAFHVGARTVHFEDAVAARNNTTQRAEKNFSTASSNHVTTASGATNRNASAFPFYNISGADSGPSGNSSSRYPFPSTSMRADADVSASATASEETTTRPHDFSPFPASRDILDPGRVRPDNNNNGTSNNNNNNMSWGRNTSSMMSMMQESPLTSAARAGSDGSVYSGADGDSTATLRQRRFPPQAQQTPSIDDSSPSPFTSFLARYVEEKKDYMRRERQYTTIGRYQGEATRTSARQDDRGDHPYAYVSPTEGRYRLTSSGSPQTLSGLPQATFHSRHPAFYLRPELHLQPPGFCQRLLCGLFPQYVENPFVVYQEKLAALSVAELSTLLEMALGEGEERQAALLVRELSRRRAAVRVEAVAATSVMH